VGIVFGGGGCAAAEQIADVPEPRARHHGVEVDDAQPFASARVEQDVGELGVVVDDSLDGVAAGVQEQAALDALLAAGAQLIDVREKDERDGGYIANSRNIPYRMLALGESDLPRDRPLVTICESGPRAVIAASVLTARGFDARPVADGGVDDWQESGRPVVEFRRCGS
jgi:rhodanese-related sulfurtransferase